MLPTMAAALLKRAVRASVSAARSLHTTPVVLASAEAGYGSTLEFDQPEGHEFESFVDVTLSDISYAQFCNRNAVPT